MISSPISLPVDLPTGEVGYCQFSKKARHPFKSAELSTVEQITIAVDFGNFESPNKIDEFFRDARDKQPIEFDTAIYARRAVENDPELIITLTLKIAAIWLGSKLALGAAKATGEIVADELKNIHLLLRSAIVKYALDASPQIDPPPTFFRFPELQISNLSQGRPTFTTSSWPSRMVRTSNVVMSRCLFSSVLRPTWSLTNSCFLTMGNGSSTIWLPATAMQSDLGRTIHAVLYC